MGLWFKLYDVFLTMLIVLAYVQLNTGVKGNFLLSGNRNIEDRASCFFTDFSSSLESIEIMEVQITI